MAKKQTLELGKRALNIALIAIGIFLVVTGVLQSDPRGWQAPLITAGLVLQTTGTIGFAKIK